MNKEEFKEDKIREHLHEREDALKNQWKKDNRERIREEYIENYENFINELWEEEKEQYL